MNLFYNFVITYCLNESKVKYQPLTLYFAACRGGKSIEIVILAFLQIPQMSREYIFGCRAVESPSLAAPRWPLRLQQSAYSFFGFFPLTLTNIWKGRKDVTTDIDPITVQKDGLFSLSIARWRIIHFVLVVDVVVVLYLPQKLVVTLNMLKKPSNKKCGSQNGRTCLYVLRILFPLD
jgi:hypothetical protein